MTGTILWALLTGMVSGAVGAGILLLRRQRPLIGRQSRQLAELNRRLDDLDAVERRLVEVEERLQFAERLLATHREALRLSPPDDGAAPRRHLPP